MWEEVTQVSERQEVLATTNEQRWETMGEGMDNRDKPTQDGMSSMRDLLQEALPLKQGLREQCTQGREEPPAAL